MFLGASPSVEKSKEWDGSLLKFIERPDLGEDMIEVTVDGETHIEHLPPVRLGPLNFGV